MGDYFKSNVKVLNFAVSGYSTVTFRSRGKWDQLLKAKPDYVFMTLGANDTPGKKHPSKAETTYKDNLRRYAAEAKAIGAKVIFVTINQSLVRDPKTNKAVFRKKTGPYVQSRAPYMNRTASLAMPSGLPSLPRLRRRASP